MGEPIDKRRLSDTQRAELLEDGAIRIIDEQTHQDITIDLQAGARLYAFMHSCIFMIIWVTFMQMWKSSN